MRYELDNWLRVVLFWPLRFSFSPREGELSVCIALRAMTPMLPFHVPRVVPSYGALLLWRHTKDSYILYPGPTHFSLRVIDFYSQFSRILLVLASLMGDWIFVVCAYNLTRFEVLEEGYEVAACIDNRSFIRFTRRGLMRWGHTFEMPYTRQKKSCWCFGHLVVFLQAFPDGCWRQHLRDVCFLSSHDASFSRSNVTGWIGFRLC